MANEGASDSEVGEPTPLPMVQMGLAVLIQLCEAMEINVLFPFMAFMVESFGITGARLGLYVGILASGFGCGQIFSSLIWGRLSDKYGRKPILVLGTLSAGVAMLIFGAAKNYPQAVLGRFLSGFMSGNLGVLKCVLTESTDNSNRVAGFGVISLAWFCGCIISPLIGGLLSGVPVEANVNSTPQWFWAMLREYPYLLPCLCCSAFNIITAILTVLFLKETRWQSLADQEAGLQQLPQPQEVKAPQQSVPTQLDDGSEGGMTQSHASQRTVKPSPKRVAPVTSSSMPMPMSVLTPPRQHRLSPVPEGSDRSAGSQSSLYASLASSAGTGVPRHFLSGYVPGEMSPSPRKHRPNGVSPDKKSRSAGSTPSNKTRPRSGTGGSGDDSRDSSPSKNGAGGFSSPLSSQGELSSMNYGAIFEQGVEMGHAQPSQVERGHGELAPLLPLHGGHASAHSSRHSLAPIEEDRSECESDSNGSESAEPRRVRTSYELLWDRSVLLTTLNYGLLILATIMLDETLPLFLKQSNETGGLGFSSRKIGILLSFSGMIALIYSVYILPKFNACNKQFLFNIASLGMIPCFMLWPLVAAAYNRSMANAEADTTAADHVLWLSLCATNVVRNCFVSLVFTVVMIQVSNSVETFELGGVNGLGQLLASIGRCLGPVIGGFMWSFGVHHDVLYLNFVLVSAILMLTCFINNTLPTSLEVSK